MFCQLHFNTSNWKIDKENCHPVTFSSAFHSPKNGHELKTTKENSSISQHFLLHWQENLLKVTSISALFNRANVRRAHKNSIDKYYETKRPRLENVRLLDRSYNCLFVLRSSSVRLLSCTAFYAIDISICLY